MKSKDLHPVVFTIVASFWNVPTELLSLIQCAEVGFRGTRLWELWSFNGWTHWWIPDGIALVGTRWKLRVEAYLKEVCHCGCDLVALCPWPLLCRCHEMSNYLSPCPSATMLLSYHRPENNGPRWLRTETPKPVVMIEPSSLIWFCLAFCYIREM